jgi:hypothetical protein
VALADREQRERAERARREVEAARRDRRRVLMVAAALLVGVVVAGVAAIIALGQRNAAQRERNLALSRQLAASSTLQLPVDPERGVLLAREAAHTARTRRELTPAERAAVDASAAGR